MATKTTAKAETNAKTETVAKTEKVVKTKTTESTETAATTEDAAKTEKAAKKYEVFIPKDPYDKAKRQSLYVSVNGQGYYFDRGKNHKVSKPYYDVITEYLNEVAEVEKKYDEVSSVEIKG